MKKLYVHNWIIIISLEENVREKERERDRPTEINAYGNLSSFSTSEDDLLSNPNCGMATAEHDGVV